MATFNQIYTMVNDATAQMYGSEALTVKDTSSLVSLGEKILSSDTDKEVFFKTLVDRIARTIVAIREFETKERSVKRDTVNWDLFVQKVSYKRKTAVENPSYDFTTQANPFDVKPSTEIIQKIFGENIGVWSYEDVIPYNQMFTAFNSASAMGAVIAGIYTNINNEYTMAKAALENLAVDTLIAGVIKKGKATQKRNVLAEFNTANSTTLTVEQALKNADFIKYVNREIYTIIGFMQEANELYNLENIIRQTPKDKLVVEILGMYASASAVYLEADTYHNELVKLPRYEEVNYWQGMGEEASFEDVSSIKIKNTGIDAGEISQSGIIACIHDYDAVAAFIDKPETGSMPNPRQRCLNVFYQSARNFGVDLSEKCVVFYMA